jgi:hypothetical protein
MEGAWEISVSALGPRYNEKAIASGAQTERRGEPGR